MARIPYPDLATASPEVRDMLGRDFWIEHQDNLAQRRLNDGYVFIHFGHGWKYLTHRQSREQN